MGKSLQMRIDLREVKPPIWRRIVVPDSLNLTELHAVIQGAMGWSDTAMHSFWIGNQCYKIPDEDFYPGPREKDERKHKIGSLLKKGSKFDYDYNFSEGWSHRIVVEEIEDTPDGTPPRCIAGKRECPLEDCGGSSGYADVVAALPDPKHPEHADKKEWAPDDFDPERFDLDETNASIDAELETYREMAPEYSRW